MMGRFIVLEGGEGAGKSSVQRLLGERLSAAGAALALTREPGGTPFGEAIRTMLLSQRSLDDPLAELLLFESARAHLVRKVIKPALERGQLVLCDRFTASSIAYQGYGRGLGRALVERANLIATGGLEPDLVLLLDLAPDEGLARRAAGGGANHFDREALAFHERVREGYLELARDDPARWRVIDAGQPIEAVVEQCHAALQGHV